MPAEYLSLQEAADRLGVHYMTVYRYVRTGRLDGVKDGAQWRVRTDDVDRLAATPPAATGRGRSHPDRYISRLEDRLVAGDTAGSWSVVESAMTSGHEPREIYLDMLVPTLRSIGDGWEQGRYTVAREHQASAVVMGIIGRLGPRFARRGRTRGSMVVGTPPGDEHGIPIAVVTDLLRSQGFRVYDLGPNVPPESFAETALGAERLVAVALGATLGDNEANIRRAIETSKGAVDVPVILGGRAITDAEHARRLGADAWSRDATALLELADQLVSRDEPSPPPTHDES